MPSRKSSNKQLRLRVFAGPNGSGKSTIIEAVRKTKVSNRPLDFGDYINADDITQSLMNDEFSFSSFKLKTDAEKFNAFAMGSGLLDETFTYASFSQSFSIKGSSFKLVDPKHAERIGQLIARFLREEMLRLKRRFSFETVFSHASNLDIMRRAKDQGYKVYLYYVTTESPEINKYRVALRVKEHGHAVPPEKIEGRYYRSLELMYDAAELAYQSFFFDNSKDHEPFELVAHFKMQGEKKVWDKINGKNQAGWFAKYYKAKD